MAENMEGSHIWRETLESMILEYEIATKKKSFFRVLSRSKPMSYGLTLYFMQCLYYLFILSLSQYISFLFSTHIIIISYYY